MINFNTEFEITLPGEKEENYLANIAANLGKFLGKTTTETLDSFELTYNSRNRHNVVSFGWTDALYNGTEEGEKRVLAACNKMEYWFNHCSFFRKHGVGSFATSYDIKRG